MKYLIHLYYLYNQILYIIVKIVLKISTISSFGAHHTRLRTLSIYSLATVPFVAQLNPMPQSIIGTGCEEDTAWPCHYWHATFRCNEPIEGTQSVQLRYLTSFLYDIFITRYVSIVQKNSPISNNNLHRHHQPTRFFVVIIFWYLK